MMRRRNFLFGMLAAPATAAVSSPLALPTRGRFHDVAPGDLVCASEGGRVDWSELDLEAFNIEITNHGLYALTVNLCGSVGDDGVQRYSMSLQRPDGAHEELAWAIAAPGAHDMSLHAEGVALQKDTRVRVPVPPPGIDAVVRVHRFGDYNPADPGRSGFVETRYVRGREGGRL